MKARESSKKGIRRFMSDTTAGVAVEYAMIAVFVSISIAFVVYWVGDEISSMYNEYLNAFRALRTRS